MKSIAVRGNLLCVSPAPGHFPLVEDTQSCSPQFPFSRAVGSAPIQIGIATPRRRLSYQWWGSAEVRFLNRVYR